MRALIGLHLFGRVPGLPLPLLRGRRRLLRGRLPLSGGRHRAPGIGPACGVALAVRLLRLTLLRHCGPGRTGSRLRGRRPGPPLLRSARRGLRRVGGLGRARLTGCRISPVRRLSAVGLLSRVRLLRLVRLPGVLRLGGLRRVRLSGGRLLRGVGELGGGVLAGVARLRLDLAVGLLAVGLLAGVAGGLPAVRSRARLLLPRVPRLPGWFGYG
ncbi:hypothetical protein SCALM49S_09869 [Streptomyces californicus]